MNAKDWSTTLSQFTGNSQPQSSFNLLPLASFKDYAARIYLPFPVILFCPTTPYHAVYDLSPFKTSNHTSPRGPESPPPNKEIKIEDGPLTNLQALLTPSHVSLEDSSAAGQERQNYSQNKYRNVMQNLIRQIFNFVLNK